MASQQWLNGVFRMPRFATFGLLTALVLLLAAGALLLVQANAGRAESEWSGVEESQVRLISATSGVGQLETLSLGLEIRLAPGFKTYWRGGYGGLPPQVGWDGSENVARAAFKWPAPEWFDILGFEAIGYKDHVVFPLEVQPVKPGKPVHIQATVYYAACSNICIPITADLELQLPRTAAERSTHAKLIDRFRSRVPADGISDGLTIESVVVSGSADKPVLHITANSTGEAFVSPDLFVEGPEDVLFKKPEVKVVANGRRAVFRVKALDVWGDPGPLDLISSPLIVTLVDGSRSMEVRVTPEG